MKTSKTSKTSNSRQRGPGSWGDPPAALITDRRCPARKTPAAAAEAIRLVAEIASLQERRAEVLARLAAEVREMDIAIDRATTALGVEVRNARIAPADMAAAVKDALAEKRVNTGQLCSRFCDAMERRGAQLWPPQYRPITSGWDVVPENTTL